MISTTVEKETKICYTAKQVIEFLSKFPENIQVECGWNSSVALIHGVNEGNGSEIIMFCEQEDTFDSEDSEDEW